MMLGRSMVVTAFPEAGTCASSMRLPLYANYDVFKEKMDEALASDPGFLTRA